MALTPAIWIPVQSISLKDNPLCKPANGWFRKRAVRYQNGYALTITMKTRNVALAIYTPIETAITPIPVATPIQRWSTRRKQASMITDDKLFGAACHSYI